MFTSNEISFAVSESLAQSISLSDEDLKSFRNAWRKLASDKETRKNLSASAHLLRCLILGIPLKKQFQAVTNRVKLANGHHPWFSLLRAANINYYGNPAELRDAISLFHAETGLEIFADPKKITTLLKRMVQEFLRSEGF